MKALKTPLRYPGGKSRACTKMDQYFPELRNYTEFREPFLGGGSAIKAVKRLRDAGYKVERVVSIVDRQENEEATTAMKLAGLELYSIFTIEDLSEEKDTV